MARMIEKRIDEGDDSEPYCVAIEKREVRRSVENCDNEIAVFQRKIASLQVRIAEVETEKTAIQTALR